MTEPVEEDTRFGHSLVDLSPTELTTVKEVWVAAQRDLGSVRKLSRYSLAAWAERTGNRFKEVGLIAFIDPFNVEVDPDDVPFLSPLVDITGRIENKDFDYEKASSEVQNGLLDGVEGRITEKGLLAPSATFVLNHA